MIGFTFILFKYFFSKKLQVINAIISINPYDEYNPAMLFPFVVHTAQTFVAIIMGSIGLLMLFIGKKKQLND